MKKLLFFLNSICLIASWQSLSCTPEAIAPNTLPISLEEAIKTFKASYPQFSVEYKHSCRCGSNYFGMKNEAGNELAEIEVGGDNFQGNRFLSLALKYAKNPCEIFEALKLAEQILWEDRKELETEFGVASYAPTATALSYQFPENRFQRFYLTIEILGENSYSSGKNLTEEFIVNTSVIIPERTDYTADIIYKKGDFRKLFLSNLELLEKYKALALENSNHIYKYAKDWKFIVSHLRELGIVPSAEPMSDLSYVAEKE